MRICHIADVHIRSNTRHNEYQKIFDELYEKLRNIKVDHIIIAGDIAHTKTQQSPEFYNFTANFFESLASIAPLHILLGNHDGNLLNPDRLDAITPIINSLKNSNIHFYKKSKRIDLDNNISLFAYSLFDKKAWNDWKIDDNKINIALYHGCVGGARTDQNYLLDAEIDISEFSRYDFAILGDIHLHQFLDKQKRIAYSGDLIQQNYGEDIEKGFLLWDIKSKNDWSTEFIPLTPVHPFFTLHFESLDDFNVEDYNFLPKKSRIRLKFLKRFDSRMIDKIAVEFKNYFDAKEIITINDLSADEIMDFNSGKIKIENLRDKQVQEELIKSYLSHLNIDDEKIKAVFDINELCNSKIKPRKDDIRNIRWKIKNIDFSNIFAFKENNSINFERLKGIIGIFGKNTIGKSSIIDIILYGLYNSNSKNVVKNLNIINTRKNKCHVKLNLEVNNTEYCIDRTSTKHTSVSRDGEVKTHAKTNLDFFKSKNQKKYSLNGLQRSDTEKHVRRVFGIIEDFLTTCVSAQGDINNFISQGSTKRKEIVGKFLDLEIFEEKYKIIKDDEKTLKSQLKMFENKDFVSELKEARNQETLLKQQLKEKNNLKIDLNNQLEQSQSNFQKLKTKQRNIENEDYNEICNEFETYKNDIENLDTELKILQAKLENSICEYEIIPDRDYEVEIESTEQKIKDVNEKNITLNHYNSEKDKLSIKIEQLEESINLLDDIPCGDKYPNCKFIKNSHNSKGVILGIKNQFENLEKKIEPLFNEANKSNLNNIEESLIQLKSQKKIKNSLKVEIDNLELQINNKFLITENTKKRFYSLKDKKFELELLDANSDDLASLKKEIKQVQFSTDNLINMLNTNEKNRLEITKKLGAAQNSIKTIVSEYNNYKSISNKHHLYAIYTKMMSKNGIQKDILKNKLAYINSEIDKLLRNIVKFKILLVEEDNNLNIYMKYKDSGGPRLIETASGMEKAITSLAIRVALTQISTLPKPDIFIIDESFGTYDETNLEAVSKMLQLLKQYFSTILVVTHIDAIKDCVDYVLTIERDQNKFSYIN